MLLDTDRHILNMKLDTDLPPLTTRQTTHIQKWGVNSKKLQKFGIESGFTAELLEEITHEHQRALNKIVLASCLLADARENAEAHARTPDSELPLACRSRPWLPRDRRVYRKKFRWVKTPG